MTEQPTRANTVVLGMGNPLMGDEGVGGAVVRRLAEGARGGEGVDFIDAGTAGMSILHLLLDRHKAVLIDCAFMGEPPGTIRRMRLDEVDSVKQLAHYSLHEADILGIIDMAKSLGQCPEDIVIFGIEPETIEPGQGLSQSVVSQMDVYLETVCDELNQDPA